MTDDEWPGEPEGGWPENPYDEDGYCEFCGNGKWKHHAPWCKWADARDARVSQPGKLADSGNSLRRIDWPHGTWDEEHMRAVCPDGKPCQSEVEWAHPCNRDVGVPRRRTREPRRPRGRGLHVRADAAPRRLAMTNAGRAAGKGPCPHQSKGLRTGTWTTSTNDGPE